jgi:hypothetical protein
MRQVIRDKWDSLGAEQGPLGYPIADEATPTAPSNGSPVFNQFQNGFIFWTPDTGVHAVYGAIASKWVSMGRESSCLRYPTSDQYETGGSLRQDFQGGYITSSPASGVMSSCGGGGMADLVIVGSDTDPDWPSPGQPFTIYFSFCNVGGAATGSFTIRIELDGGVDSTDIQVGPYAAGACDRVHWNYPGLSAGDHYFYAYLDVDNEVPESNEQNNIGYHGLTIF